MTKVYHFIHHAERKTTTVYKQEVKQIVTKKYKRRFFNDYVEVTSFIQALKVKHACYAY